MAAGESHDGIEINGVAHVILRVKRITECIAFYDLLMPFLGLKAVPPRSDFFVYYVGGRTAVAIRQADAEHADVAHVETGPGLDHLCFRARSREDVDRGRESRTCSGARPSDRGPASSRRVTDPSAPDRS